jgi:large subunit ribosomal protein L22
VKNTVYPGTSASLRHARFSASKARPVLALIKGKPIEEAREILESCPRYAAKPILKVLNSAVSNAAENEGLNTEELEVSGCFADESMTLKRWRPRARGRAGRIRKRTCHITVEVSVMDPESLERYKKSKEAEAAIRRQRRVAAQKAKEREKKLRKATAEKGLTEESSSEKINEDEQSNKTALDNETMADDKTRDEVSESSEIKETDYQEVETDDIDNEDSGRAEAVKDASEKDLEKEDKD